MLDSTQLYQVYSSLRQANSILVISILTSSKNSVLLDVFLSKGLEKMKYLSRRTGVAVIARL